MARPTPTPQGILAALAGGRASEARRDSAALLAARPRDVAAWIAAARVEQADGNYAGMAAAAERAGRLGGPPVLCAILRASAALGRGEMEAALEGAERAVRAASGPERLEAEALLGEVLHFAHRTEDLARVLAESEALRADPRGRMLLARLRRREGDTAGAEALFRALAEDASAPLAIRRAAGFDRARLLERAGEYEASWEAARATHAATTPPFDTGGLVAELEACAALARRGAFRTMRRAPAPVPPTALISAVPRSGTTLLEQMLDLHPAVTGVGELPAVEALAAGITALGGWPEGVVAATPAELARLRDAYVGFVRGVRATPPEGMTLDKTLHTWRRLPAVAAALPGARIIRMVRDPRDTAVSLFLSSMHPRAMGWNASLADIRRVIEAERRIVPDLARALGLDMLTIRYEAFIGDPRAHLERVLGFLGLPWCDACLAPERNRRAVVTLSHEQVRRPVNAESVGRWRHHAARFDASWEALAAMGEAE
jgi:hypothetical protein